MLTGLSLLLPATLLTGCKGRTASEVEPDGSAPVEVTVPETESATAARDTLRARVGAQAPEAAQTPGANESK